MGGRPGHLLGHTFRIAGIEVQPIKLEAEGLGVEFSIESILDGLPSLIELIHCSENDSKVAVPNHIVVIDLNALPLKFEGVLITTHDNVGIAKISERNRIARGTVEPFAID